MKLEQGNDLSVVICLIYWMKFSIAIEFNYITINEDYKSFSSFICNLSFKPYHKLNMVLLK